VSQQRHKQGGWCDVRTMPRGPNGRCLCRQCGAEVPVGRLTFCSKGCVDQWQIRTSAAYARQKVFDRDHGVCAKCGVDVFADIRRTRRSKGSGDLWQADHIVPVAEGGGECDLSNLRTLCTACHRIETAALRKRLRESKNAATVA